MLINISKSILHITYLKVIILVKLCNDLMYVKYCSNLAIIIITVKDMLPLPPTYAILVIYHFFKIFLKRAKKVELTSFQSGLLLITHVLVI